MEKKILIFIMIIAKCYSQVDTSKYKIIWTGQDSILIEKPNKADIAFGNGNYKEAIKEYKAILISSDPSIELLYNLAGTYSILNQNDSAFKYLHIANKEDSSLMFLYNSKFYNLISDKRWSEIESNQLRKVKKKNKIQYKNDEVVLLFLRMMIIDQAFYNEINHNDARLGRESKENIKLWKIKNRLNKENVKKLEKVVKESGWPKRSEYGEMVANSAFLIIQHASYKTQKKYLPLIRETCVQKENAWENFAYLKDRILISEGKEQLYGTQVKFDAEKQQYQFFPIEDISNVDKRRSEIGLPSLKYYALDWGIDFVIPQTK